MAYEFIYSFNMESECVAMEIRMTLAEAVELPAGVLDQWQKDGKRTVYIDGRRVITGGVTVAVEDTQEMPVIASGGVVATSVAFDREPGRVIEQVPPRVWPEVARNRFVYVLTLEQVDSGAEFERERERLRKLAERELKLRLGVVFKRLDIS